MQMNLTGFLNAKNARTFIQGLWELLLSAQENIGGIPAVFLEQKKEEIKLRQVMRICLVSIRIFMLVHRGCEKPSFSKSNPTQLVLLGLSVWFFG